VASFMLAILCQFAERSLFPGNLLPVRANAGLDLVQVEDSEKATALFLYFSAASAYL